MARIQRKTKRDIMRVSSDLTLKRVNYLHRLALDTKQKNGERYISMMEKIGRRMDFTLPSRIKRSYCKKCRHPYGPDSRIRLKNRLITVVCSNCGDVRRIPY